MKYKYGEIGSIDSADLYILFLEIVSGKYGCVVHDSTAFVLGGVAGHAGLFSTIMDVCRVPSYVLAHILGDKFLCMNAI